MEVTSGPVVITLGPAEAAAFARQLAEAIRLAYGTRQAEPPWLLRTVAGRIHAEIRARPGRTDPQASARHGPPRGRELPAAASCDQPVRLSSREAAKLAEADPRTIRKWITRGEIDATRDHRGGYRIDIASLWARLSDHRRQRERKAA